MRFLLVAFVSTACGGPAWRSASQADTSAAYLAFVAASPSSVKAGAALRRAEERAWAEAQTSRSAADYASYVTSFPNGERAAEARTFADRLAFEAAVTDGSASALSAYLTRYPTGAHVTEASAALERAWVADARSEGTEEAWGRYLVRYPDGAQTAEARTERDRLAWNATTDAGTLPAYAKYLDRYLDGAHVDEARAWIAATHVPALQPLLVLTYTWQDSSQHAAAVARLQTELEKGLLAELRAAFQIRPTQRAVATDRSAPSPEKAMAVEAGVGLLVVEVEERIGRPFEPDGAATDLVATVRLFVPPSASAVVTRKIEASTPERVVGNAESSLYTSAVHELGMALRTAAPEVEAFRADGR